MKKILILSDKSFTIENARQIRGETGYLVILAPDVNDIKTLDPSDKDTIIRWLSEDDRKTLITKMPRISKFKCKKKTCGINHKHNDEFEIGQGYEEIPARKVICIKCGTDRFILGKGNYYTALKCPNCLYEICIHEG